MSMICAAVFFAIPMAGTIQDQKAEEKQEKQEKHRFVRQRLFQLDKLQRVKIKVNKKYEYNAWVMDQEIKRQEGMMFLEGSDFKTTDAMVFAFKDPLPLSFWMKNTYVPLDIAYCDAKGKILNTYTMQPLDVTSNFLSKGNAKYAVEFKAGTFRKKKITAGMIIEIPKTVKAKD